MYVYWCIVIFLQVDYCLLKPQKRFELNWFNVAITTTGRLGLRWFPTVSWKVGKCKYLHSQIVPYTWSNSRWVWLRNSPLFIGNSSLKVVPSQSIYLQQKKEQNICYFVMSYTVRIVSCIIPAISCLNTCLLFFAIVNSRLWGKLKIFHVRLSFK